MSHITYCNDICLKYKANLPEKHHSRYAVGQKRCSACQIFIKYDGKYCPCCGTYLRRNPRNMRNKRRIAEMIRSKI